MYRDIIEKMREKQEKEKEESVVEIPDLDTQRLVEPTGAGGGKRRSMKRKAPVSRDYIRLLVDKVDNIKYGWCISDGGRFTPEEQRLRNKALPSLLYLSARRISEIVGRKHIGTKSGYVDVYEGVKVKDFKKDTLEGSEVLVMSCRILKKWKRKIDEPRIVMGDVIMDMEDVPFINHILTWLEHQKRRGEEEKYMPIHRSRAYQILQQIDPRIVGPHWFRHMRLTHLAETMNPYQLNEQIGFWEKIDPAIAYVHGRVSDYLTACEKARGVTS